MSCPAGLQESGAQVIEKALLSNFTTFRLGGPAPWLADCPSLDSFKTCWQLSRDANPILIGGGSNLLIQDAGVDRPVIRYVEAAPVLKWSGSQVTIHAGSNLDEVARITAGQGFDGLVMCSGIPGTVGGATAGNAGAFGEQIGDRIVEAELMDAQGRIFSVPREQLGFAYRRSDLQQRREAILRITVALSPGDRDALLARRKDILELRASKHPDWHKTPTAGSFFKNIEPTSKAGKRQAAGFYLEQAGALSMRVGGARTFDRHANIIITEPGATAADVMQLSQMMADAVKQKFGLDLEREVKMIGAGS